MAVDTYTRVNWEDYPSTDTPINASNLNKMDAGIKANNNGIKALETAQGAADISSIGDGTVKGAISTLNNDLTDKLGGTYDTFQFSTDGNGNYGYVKKVNGADTFFPFREIAKVGTYSDNATINVSTYKATNSSQFLLVPNGVVTNQNSGYVGNVPTKTVLAWVDGSLVLNGNNLTVTLPQIKNTLSGNATHNFNTKMTCDLYFIR